MILIPIHKTKNKLIILPKVIISCILNKKAIGEFLCQSKKKIKNLGANLSLKL